MCFSATASFTMAGVNAVAGAAVLRKANGDRDTALGAFPVVFAAQQAVEGALWLALPEHGASVSMLANSYAGIALAIWPALVPLAAMLVESGARRALLMRLLLVLGIAFAGYAMLDILKHPYGAQVVGHCLSYTNGREFPVSAMVAYGMCTCAPLLLSSLPSLRSLGIWVMLGAVVSVAYFFLAFFSVWCFFASVASGIIFFRVFVEKPALARMHAR